MMRIQNISGLGAVDYNAAADWNYKNAASVGYASQSGHKISASWDGKLLTFSDSLDKNLPQDRLNAIYSKPAFAQAVEAWQKRHGLTADGKLGKQTWAKMKQEIWDVQTAMVPKSSSASPGPTVPAQVENASGAMEWLKSNWYYPVGGVAVAGILYWLFRK